MQLKPMACLLQNTYDACLHLHRRAQNRASQHAEHTLMSDESDCMAATADAHLLLRCGHEHGVKCAVSPRVSEAHLVVNELEVPSLIDKQVLCTKTVASGWGL